jgi:hypothetical protein
MVTRRVCFLNLLLLVYGGYAGATGASFKQQWQLMQE